MNEAWNFAVEVSEAVVELTVAYEVDCATYWDNNNGGANYVVD